MTKYYKLYKDEIIECPYCERILNIYDISIHIKTKRCIEIQKFKYNEDELKTKKINLLILIDKMRYESRNKD